MDYFQFFISWVYVILILISAKTIARLEARRLQGLELNSQTFLRAYSLLYNSEYKSQYYDFISPRSLRLAWVFA